MQQRRPRPASLQQHPRILFTPTRIILPKFSLRLRILLIMVHIMDILRALVIIHLKVAALTYNCNHHNILLERLFKSKLRIM